MVNSNRKLVGRLDRVLLSNINRPSLDKYNFFHPANISKIVFQIEGELCEAPNGMPLLEPFHSCAH